jgi:hypothetical protein
LGVLTQGARPGRHSLLPQLGSSLVYVAFEGRTDRREPISRRRSRRVVRAELGLEDGQSTLNMIAGDGQLSEVPQHQTEVVEADGSGGVVARGR